MALDGCCTQRFGHIRMGINEAAEGLADKKLRSFINAHPDMTETLGATAIQGHAITDGGDA